MKYLLIISLATFVIYFAKAFIKSRKGKQLLSRNDTIDERYNAVKRIETQKIDEILDKVAERGESSLSRYEKELLDNYSKK